ncbi:MAG TPA: trypsin-like serine protease [Oligoflexus sp.]|uniref:trypsin-like serine protease n=1 Tax=Oligoflexus sp. TaxID=1971216 RepID=UPI002D5EF9A6|nr:trypsin-like serine protease [Oligoflexus sp.]HYX35077.1 trypsin-like serine protease [Oligoflexus sp.]
MPRAVLVKAQDKKFICNAVVYRPTQVLVPLHCLSDLDPKSILLKSVPGKHFQDVASVRSLVDREGYFPSYDIAVLDLQKPWPNFQELKDWIPKPNPPGSFVLETVRPDTLQVVRIPLKWVSSLQGPRLTPLLLMEAQGRDRPCYGDSGGSVVHEAGHDKRLVGFLTGLSYPLTSSSFRCDDSERLITPLEPYKKWIAGLDKDGVHRQKSKPFYLAMEDLCQGQDYTSDSWPLMQNVILSLIPTEQQKPKLAPLREALISCKGLDVLWNAAVATSKPIKFEAVANPKELRFLASVKNATFQAVDQSELGLLAQWQGLEILTLNGTEAGVDLTGLGSLTHLKQLNILHSQGFKGLTQALKDHANVQSLTLFNSKPALPDELSTLQHTRPQLKISVEK